jgi:hypothetical protein
MVLVASVLVGLVLLAPAASAQSTYTYAGGTINSFGEGDPPTNGSTRQTYSLGGSITGSFTTTAPLAANLSSQNIGALVTAYSFNDSQQTYASTNPNVRKITFSVTTNGSGAITGADIVIHKWQTNGPRSAAGLASADSRFERIIISPISSRVSSNRACLALGVGVSAAGDNDFCDLSSGDEEFRATTGDPGVWTLPPASVPTLSEWAMILFGLLLAGGAALYIQRRQLTA